MPPIPQPVAEFLAGKRIAVAGVSRSRSAAANAIFRRLRQCGHEVIPINPNAKELEGTRAYPDLASAPGPIHALMVATHPRVATALVLEAAGLGIRHIWFHRSLGQGSVSPEAVEVCRKAGIEPIVGGCPLMYCRPVDPAHGILRWWLHLLHRVPG